MARTGRQALIYLASHGAAEVEQYLHYFCGDAANAEVLNETEPLRVAFYKAVAAFCPRLCGSGAGHDGSRL